MNVPVYDRAQIIAAAIGQAIACRMPIPSAPVTSSQEYFDSNIMSEAMNLISSFNEQAVLNVTLSLDYTRKFWLMRYDISAKCPRRTRADNSFFSAFFGVNDYFSGQEQEFLDKNFTTIFDVYSSVCDCLAEALDAAVTAQNPLV